MLLDLCMLLVSLGHAITQLLVCKCHLRLIETWIHNYQAFDLVFKRLVRVLLELLVGLAGRLILI